LGQNESEAMDEQKLPGMPGRDETLKTVDETMDQARSMAHNATEQVWSAAATAGAMAQDLAKQAREQTSAATDTLYQQASAAGDVIYEQGARAGQYLTRNVNEYPLTALLLAGLLGYGMAYLMHSRWQSLDH
jgi:ElaB/YqjD/DUF883 family membrane-anchored ribosome-binding protein